MGFAEIAKAWKPETVHGLREISTPLTLKSVLTIMWVCACSVLCLWEVYNTVVTFIRFDVKTTSEVLEAKTDGIPFPGITVCSASIGRKSFLGGSPEKTISLMSLMTRTTDVSKLNPMVETCRGASPPIELRNQELVTMLQRSMVDSANAVKQCQWQQKEIDCGRLFVNKPTDSGLCFTFNPALELLVAYRLRNSSDDKESWNGKTAYGTSVNESTVFISFETGLSSGLSLVLLSNSSDYCGSVQERAGFTAVVHDRSAEPLLQMSKDIRLSPGFIANVAMTLQKTERQTESFGYCKSSLYLRMYKAVVPYTSSDFYTQNCLSEGILLRCGCLPFYTPRTNNFIYEEFPEIIGPQNRSISIPTCGLSGSLDELNCQTSVENNLLHRESICYRFRPKPCRETNIRTETSFTKFPSARMLSNWNRRFGTHYALDQFRLNFVVVNFFYHDYEYTQLGEKIKMTWVDLMNQIGGAAGMTLGISIVGGIECICWFFFQVLLSCLKLKNVCKNTQTLKYNYTDLLA